MVIYKSEIRRALERWKNAEVKLNTEHNCEYESPKLTSEFIRKIAKILGLPTSDKYIRVLRPYIREMKKEGVI